MYRLMMAVRFLSEAGLETARSIPTMGTQFFFGKSHCFDHIFKALALGAPYVKAICMGRALMIPGMVGKNIGEWIKDEPDADRVHAIIDERIEAFRAVAHKAADEALATHALLTPEQRAEIGERIREHMEDD